MTSSTVKRSLIKTFLNTGTSISPTWSLIGDGVSSAAIKYSPETSDETYIHQDSATIDVESYKPTLPVQATAKQGDAVFNFIDALRKGRKVLADARAEIVNVWLYTTPTSNQYEAERQTVSIAIEDFGGDGGKSAEINYTINFVGDPVLGTFNPTTLAFTANPNLASLSTLVIGSLVLSPVFSAGQLWYTTTTSAASAALSSTVTDTGNATVVQKNGSTTIAQAGLATWALGANTVTFTVTDDTEVCVYTVIVTKTA